MNYSSGVSNESQRGNIDKRRNLQKKEEIMSFSSRLNKDLFFSLSSAFGQWWESRFFAKGNKSFSFSMDLYDWLSKERTDMNF